MRQGVRKTPRDQLRPHLADYKHTLPESLQTRSAFNATVRVLSHLDADTPRPKQTPRDLFGTNHGKAKDNRRRLLDAGMIEQTARYIPEVENRQYKLTDQGQNLVLRATTEPVITQAKRTDWTKYGTRSTAVELIEHDATLNRILSKPNRLTWSLDELIKIARTGKPSERVVARRLLRNMVLFGQDQTPSNIHQSDRDGRLHESQPGRQNIHASIRDVAMRPLENGVVARVDMTAAELVVRSKLAGKLITDYTQVFDRLDIEGNPKTKRCVKRTVQRINNRPWATDYVFQTEPAIRAVYTLQEFKNVCSAVFGDTPIPVMEVRWCVSDILCEFIRKVAEHTVTGSPGLTHHDSITTIVPQDAIEDGRWPLGESLFRTAAKTTIGCEMHAKTTLLFVPS